MSIQVGLQFTKLDLYLAYYQIPLAPEPGKFVTINTPSGLFQFTRLPFGVATGPGSFQRIIEQVLAGIKVAGVFLDDIITGKTEKEHSETLDKMLARVQGCGLTLKLSKCKFFQDEVIYLRFKIDRYGLHTTKDKIKAILEAPVPEILTCLPSFLGIVHFCSHFIPDAVTILDPLYDQLAIPKLEWNEKCDQIFKKIKETLTKAPVFFVAFQSEFTGNFGMRCIKDRPI